MKKFAVLLILLAFCTVFAHGQAIRADIPLLTSGPNVPVTGYPLPQALIVANATIALCNHPSVNLAACTPIVTYTSSAGSATCLSTKPLVQLPGTTCSATTGLLGDIGFWYAGGTIDYFVTTMYGTYGPYSYSGGTGGGGGGGSGVTITTVLGLASVPEKTNGTIAVVTDGQTITSCTGVGGGVYLVNCQYNGTTWSQLAASSTGGTSFPAITGGTNTNALVIGSGGSLTTSGSGIITATTAGNLFGSPTLPSGITMPSGIFSTGATYSFITGLTQCLHVNSSGVLSGTGADCQNWPGGVASGIPAYSYPNAWGSVYNASSPIPANYLATTIASNTTGTAANLSGTQQANFIYAAPNGTTGLGLFRPAALADLTAGGFTTGSNSYIPTSPSLAGSANILLVQDGSGGMVPATGIMNSGGAAPTLFTFYDNTTPSVPSTGYTEVYSKSGKLCSESPSATEACTVVVATQSSGDNSNNNVATTAYANTVYNLIETSGSPFTLLGITGYYWNNSGAAYTFQLDVPVAGKQYCFGNYTGETHAITVKSTGSVYIVYKGANGGSGTSGTLVSGGAAGDFVCMEGVDSTHYMVTGAGYGTWTNN